MENIDDTGRRPGFARRSDRRPAGHVVVRTQIRKEIWVRIYPDHRPSRNSRLLRRNDDTPWQPHELRDIRYLHRPPVGIHIRKRPLGRRPAASSDPDIRGTQLLHPRANTAVAVPHQTRQAAHRYYLRHLPHRSVRHEIPHRIHQAGPVRLRSRHGPQHGTMAERTIHTDRHPAPDMEC